MPHVLRLPNPYLLIPLALTFRITIRILLSVMMDRWIKDHLGKDHLGNDILGAA